MRQKKRISQILMIAVLCVFIVYIGLYMNKKKDWITQESRMELSSFLLRQAEMTYLPVFSKVSSGDRGCSPGHWLARNAMELIPLGMYMEEISPAATDVEDKETYEMILAKQAADENAVDADGKLIGEEESKRETDAHIDAAQKKARGQAKKIVAAAEENMHTAVNEIIRGIFEKWQ